jgi:hypothetical protein
MGASKQLNSPVARRSRRSVAERTGSDRELPRPSGLPGMSSRSIGTGEPVGARPNAPGGRAKLCPRVVGRQVLERPEIPGGPMVLPGPRRSALRRADRQRSHRVAGPGLRDRLGQTRRHVRRDPRRGDQARPFRHRAPVVNSRGRPQARDHARAGAEPKSPATWRHGRKRPVRTLVGPGPSPAVHPLPRYLGLAGCFQPARDFGLDPQRLLRALPRPGESPRRGGATRPGGIDNADGLP